MERTKQIRKENLNPAMSTYYRSPLLIHKGSMQWLWDHEGRRYLDMFGGIVTVSVGHCHPKVNEALEQQLKTLWHTTNIYLHPKVTFYANTYKLLVHTYITRYMSMPNDWWRHYRIPSRWFTLSTAEAKPTIWQCSCRGCTPATTTYFPSDMPTTVCLPTPWA